jgi:hypothetical protein
MCIYTICIVRGAKLRGRVRCPAVGACCPAPTHAHTHPQQAATTAMANHAQSVQRAKMMTGPTTAGGGAGSRRRQPLALLRYAAPLLTLLLLAGGARAATVIREWRGCV